MSWIKTIPYADATGRLKRLYDRIKGPDDNVDNIMMAHSLRPHTMEGHMALYKNVLHHGANTIPGWFRELLGVWVSFLNGCDYCVAHHFAGLKRLLDDDAVAEAIRAAIEERDIGALPLEGVQKMAMLYAQELTQNPAGVIEPMVAGLRAAGLEDAEILEINQVVAYFNYANRTVLGLGVTTAGDVPGLSPGNGEDPDDWTHG